ncbi:hypothetical protein ABE021_02075 [Sporosarcina gallistercoris]|uniref:hypothetical protein n=1 Tax=Sporosarcina gallistercoris TaxID=2762245 RepID=UPI003D28D840
MDHKQEDDDLEKLLHSMPKIKDTRSKEEVMKRLGNDERLLTTPLKPLRKRGKIAPLLVAAAAVLLVAVLIPSFMNSMDNGTHSADEATIQESRGVPATAREEKETENFSRDATAEPSAFKGNTSQYAVYPADLQGGRIVHMGVQGGQAVALPISILLTREQIEAEGLTESSTELELYKAFIGLVDEQALGFEPFQPMDATYTEKGDQLNVVLNDTHAYDQSSSAQELFLQSLMQTFPSYREIHILDGSGNPAEFDQVGQLEPLRMQGVQAHTPYYVYRQKNGQEYLSPNFMQQAASFEEALKVMQIAPNDLFAAAIPEELDFTVTEKYGVAEVEFSERVRFDTMDLEEASRLIDALTLTAASFDVQLKLSNVEPLEWNGWDFRKPLPTALGANPVQYNE